jgi:lysophospholipase L1-like esterase
MRIYFFGDSICFGQFVSPHRIWVNQVATRLEKIYTGLVVQNPSVNGRTTRQALEDMPYQVQAHCPDVVYVQFGMNDCNHWVSDNGTTRVSLQSFEANLTEIILRARLSGARQVFLATNHPTPRVVPYDNVPGITISYQESNARFNATIRQVAADQGVVLIDNEAHWLSRDLNTPAALQEMVLPDGIHLSESGHAVYADYVSSQLEPYLGA